VLDDALWTAVFGGVVAGGSLRLAQRADAIAPVPKQGRLDGVKTADRDTQR